MEEKIKVPQLLIDNISYFDVTPDYVDKDQNGISKEDGAIVLTGILQRANVPNQNRRIYPKWILEREVNKLLPLVRDNQIVSAIDHPDCVDRHTDILTKDGWKSIVEISDDEEIYTLNRETKKIEIQKISRKINQPYKGKMIKFSGRQVDMLVTPNHRIPLFKEKTGEFKFVYAEELYKARKNKEDIRYIIAKNGIWSGVDEEYFVLPKWEGMFAKRYTVFPEVKIKMEDWLAFFGFWLAEGHVVSNDNILNTKLKHKSHKVCVSQVKEETLQKIQDMLDKLPFNFNERHGHTWECSNIQLHSYLKQFGKANTKHIPTEIKQLSPKLLSILLDWMILGDGRTRKVKRTTKTTNEEKEYSATKYNSVSKRLIDDVSEISLKIGNSSSLHIQRQIDRYIGDRLIKEENSQIMYDLNISKSKNIYMRGTIITEEDFDDNVYCVTVPNEIFYIRRNGKSCWTGNSSIVEFDRACALVKDMWWNGDDVMGRLQVIKGHPSGDKVLALMKNKVKIGISSRGLGSTIPALEMEEYRHYGEGYDVVDEDFNLITFDIVNNPSTHGAFLVTEQLLTEWNTNYLIKNPKETMFQKNIKYFIEKYK